MVCQRHGAAGLVCPILSWIKQNYPIPLDLLYIQVHEILSDLVDKSTQLQGRLCIAKLASGMSALHGTIDGHVLVVGSTAIGIVDYRPNL